MPKPNKEIPANHCEACNERKEKDSKRAAGERRSENTQIVVAGLGLLGLLALNKLFGRGKE